MTPTPIVIVWPTCFLEYFAYEWPKWLLGFQSSIDGGIMNAADALLPESEDEENDKMLG